MVNNIHKKSSAKMTLQCVLMIIVFELLEVYVLIKMNKANMKFFEKTRNGKLITYNEKLVIMYLSVSK